MTLRSAKKEPLWTRNFILITVCNFLYFMPNVALPTTVPIYLKSAAINAPDGIIGLAVGITTIAGLLFRPLVGTWVDKPGGRRLIFILGMLGMVVTYAPLGLINSIPLFFVVRFLSGFGWAAANTAGSTIATDIIPRSRIGEGIGFFSLASSVSLAIAPAASLFLLTDVGTSFEFVMILSAGLLLLSVVLTLFLRTKRLEEPTTTHVPQTGKVETSARHATATPATPTTPATSTTPAPPAKRFSLMSFFERRSILPSAIVLSNCLVLGAISSFVALLATERGIENVSLYFLLYAILLIIARTSAGRLADKKGYRLPVSVGLICSVIALVLIATACSLTQLLVAAVFFGIGQGMVVAALQTMAVAGVPFERRGAANSTFFTGYDAGLGFGPLISGVIATFLGYGNLFFVAIVAPLVGLFFFLYFARNRANLPSEATPSDLPKETRAKAE